MICIPACQQKVWWSESGSLVALNVLSKLCEKLSGEIKDIEGKIEVLGIESLDASSVVFRISLIAKPLSHFAVKREILKQVKLEFDKHKIKIPYPQVEVHNGAKI